MKKSKVVEYTLGRGCALDEEIQKIVQELEAEHYELVSVAVTAMESDTSYVQVLLHFRQQYDEA